MAKKEKAPEAASKPGALPPTFTDMLALLLTFFVFLMTMAQFDDAKIKEAFEGMSLAFGSLGDAATGSLEDGSSLNTNKMKMGGGAHAAQAKAPEKATLRGGDQLPGKGSPEPSEKIVTKNLDKDGGGPEQMQEAASGEPVQTVGEESMVQVAQAEQEKFQEGLLELGDMPGVDANLTTQGLKIELQEGFARFGSGSADLPPDAIPKLRDLIQNQLQGFIDDSFEISVSGHTDDVALGAKTAAIYGDNRGLSTERANTVLRMFEDLGVNPKQISAQGYGPHVPKAANDNAENRGLNRRIEILVKYKVFSQNDWGS